MVDAVIKADAGSAAIAATEKMLKSAGIEVLAAPSDSPTDPPAGIAILPEQLPAIAADAKGRAESARFNLEEVATTMVGVKKEIFKYSPDPGGIFEHFLATWVSGAKDAPDGPSKMAPLLIQELANHQDPPIDVSNPNYAPADLRLGNADLLLLWAGIAQMAPAFAPLVTPSPSSASPQAAPYAAPPQLELAERQAADPLTPCKQVVDTLNHLLPFAGTVWGKTTGKVVEAAEKWWVSSMGELLKVGDAAEVAEGFETFLKIVDLVAKAQALGELYGSMTADASVEGKTTIPRPQPSDYTTFKVKVAAGIDDTKWAAFKAKPEIEFDKIIHDCAETLGLPHSTGTGDLAPGIKNWTVDWPHPLDPAVAYSRGLTWTGPYSYSDYLIPNGDHSGDDVQSLDVKGAQDGTGPLVTVPVYIETKTTPLASPAEQLKGVIEALIAGAVDPAVGLGSLALSWLNYGMSLTRIAKVNITHHEQGHGWSGSISSTFESILYGDDFNYDVDYIRTQKSASVTLGAPTEQCTFPSCTYKTSGSGDAREIIFEHGVFHNVEDPGGPNECVADGEITNVQDSQAQGSGDFEPTLTFSINPDGLYNVFASNGGVVKGSYIGSSKGYARTSNSRCYAIIWGTQVPPNRNWDGAGDPQPYSAEVLNFSTTGKIQGKADGSQPIDISGVVENTDGSWVRYNLHFVP